MAYCLMARRFARHVRAGLQLPHNPVIQPSRVIRQPRLREARPQAGLLAAGLLAE
jgi:hypothetical protein